MVWVAALEVWLTACIASAAARDRLRGVRGVDLDGVGKLLDARVERVSGGLGADLDLLGDVLGARPKLLRSGPMRVSRLLATRSARVPSARSICSILAPTLSAKAVPRR